jgi:hypothetical protein
MRKAPPPESRVSGNIRITDNFDAEKYYSENRESIQASAVLEILGGLNNSYTMIDLDNHLNKIPITANVLVLTLCNFIFLDDRARKQILSNRNTSIAQKNRKEKPTKAQLLEFQTKWTLDYLLEHGVKTDRG